MTALPIAALALLSAMLLLASVTRADDLPAYLYRHKLPEPVLRPTHTAGDFDTAEIKPIIQEYFDTFSQKLIIDTFGNFHLFFILDHYRYNHTLIRSQR